jgi:hypothetical protein
MFATQMRLLADIGRPIVDRNVCDTFQLRAEAEASGISVQVIGQLIQGFDRWRDRLALQPSTARQTE